MGIVVVPSGRAFTVKSRRSKYRAVKTTVDNIVFDSRREGVRYVLLKALFRAGKIQNLEVQPAFHFLVNGEKIFTYYADFSYFDDGVRVVEDVKGFKTPLYRLKKKLIEAQHQIQIKEVR